jgi:Flp pilus assembly protein TadD
LLNTLGVAQYRVGEYGDALKTLSRSDELHRNKTGQSSCYDLAFLAMTQQRLGQREEARAMLQRLRELMQQPALAADAESLSFLREAEALIEGQPGPMHNRSSLQ